MFWPRVARFLFWLGGWSYEGGVPDVRKAVVIAAPHTSNWDGYWAFVYKVAIGFDVKFFFKDSLFWFPLGSYVRLMGAMPLDREHAGSAVQQVVDLMNSSDEFFFGLAPEGTRSWTPAWKTGFYRIAIEAGVPVAPGFLDYGRKCIGIGPLITLSGDPETDMEKFRAFYAGIEGKRPEKAGPIMLADKQ
jgi:1-acyl-sn-glycerol-3-phosphate acyltransferase